MVLRTTMVVIRLVHLPRKFSAQTCLSAKIVNIQKDLHGGLDSSFKSDGIQIP